MAYHSGFRSEEFQFANRTHGGSRHLIDIGITNSEKISPIESFVITVADALVQKKGGSQPLVSLGIKFRRSADQPEVIDAAFNTEPHMSTANGVVYVSPTSGSMTLWPLHLESRPVSIVHGDKDYKSTEMADLPDIFNQMKTRGLIDDSTHRKLTNVTDLIKMNLLHQDVDTQQALLTDAISGAKARA